MSVPAVRWVAGWTAVGSVALGAGGLVLAYADPPLLADRLTVWNFSSLFGDVAILAVPVVALWLAWPAGAGRGWLPGRWLG